MSNPRHHPDHLRVYALFERRAGVSCSKIARTLGLNQSTVARWCIAQEIIPANVEFPPAEIPKPTPEVRRPIYEFRTITVEDWKRNLRMARERRAGAIDRNADSIIRHVLGVRP